ncbi:hypothetical protein EON81_24050 [bacterium]|nr:MAG: hypothetical protein EON81_24050 [bacterium]
MNPKKLSSESPWMRNELRALRAEAPNPEEVDRAVNAVRAYRPVPNQPRHLWKAVPVAACLGIGAFLFLVAPQSAQAASLREIADALKQQTLRHSKTFRPDSSGELLLTNEDWIEGAKHASAFHEADGEKVLTGYDGRTMFRVSSKDGGFIDDVAPSGLPVEDIDSYLQIPGARVLKQTSAGKLNLYTVAYSNVKFDLYVDPATRLPVRRDVLSLQGRLIEKNEYDYPARLSPELFRAPRGGAIFDYLSLRKQLSRRLSQPGQIVKVGGVEISLKAVIIGKSRIIALWTGGAKGEGKDKGVWIEGMAKPIASGPLEGLQAPLRGSGVWYANLKLDEPFTINVPVWKDSRKLVGHATFRVGNALRAPDPDRVVFKPSGEGIAVATGEIEKANP